jgi:hypothetical protein
MPALTFGTALLITALVAAMTGILAGARNRTASNRSTTLSGTARATPC